MTQYFEKSRLALGAASDKVNQQLNSGLRTVKEKVAGLSIYISSERTNKYDVKYDEKHYFVIPFKLAEQGFVLHTMRCLPESIPEINDLPKRRIFHFPNLYYEATLREHMIQCAVAMSQEKMADKKHTLEELADDIDALDAKLTYGMLLIGGLAAIVNPLVGAGIAAKALMPGAAGLFNKYGLRPLGQKLTKSQAEKEAKHAEAAIMKQFSESSTFKVVNPLLQELELALRTTQDQHDPLMDPNLGDGNIPELEHERWRELTETAIFHTYHEVVKDRSQHKSACLGPEDLRWLNVIFSNITL